MTRNLFRPWVGPPFGRCRRCGDPVETARCSAVLDLLVGLKAHSRTGGDAGNRQRSGIVSGIGEAMTMAASTKSLFRRGVGKRISGAATFLGRAIRVLASDRDRA